MKRNRTLLGRMLGAFLSAHRVSSAVEGHRPPQPADLRRLGIDPASFTSIGHG